MAPSPAPSSNRDLLWLIFGALMLIAGMQAAPLVDRSLREVVGLACLSVAGLVFAARLVMGLLKQAADNIPSPLTDRTNHERPSTEQK